LNRISTGVSIRGAGGASGAAFAAPVGLEPARADAPRLASDVFARFPAAAPNPASVTAPGDVGCFGVALRR
jgi:hypothetical protein